MKKIDLQLIAAFLDSKHQEFAGFLQEEKEIEGSEGDFILEAVINEIDGLEDASLDAEEELLP
jgi:hypothetical protein